MALICIRALICIQRCVDTAVLICIRCSVLICMPRGRFRLICMLICITQLSEMCICAAVSAHLHIACLCTAHLHIKSFPLQCSPFISISFTYRHGNICISPHSQVIFTLPSFAFCPHLHLHSPHLHKVLSRRSRLLSLYILLIYISLICIQLICMHSRFHTGGRGGFDPKFGEFYPKFWGILSQIFGDFSQKNLGISSQIFRDFFPQNL